MRPTLAFLAPGLLAALAASRVDGAVAPSFASLPTAAVALDEFASKLLELSDEYDEALQELYAQYDERWGDFDHDSATAEQQAAHAKWWADHQPAPRFLPRFESLALEAGASDTAVKSWAKVLELAPQSGAAAEPAAKRALAALAKNTNSPAMEGVAEQLQYAWGLPDEEVWALLGALRDNSPHRAVQAAATFALAQNYLQASGEGLRDKARTLLEDLRDRFADLRDSRARPWGDIASGFLFELDHLQIGMIAPDIEAIDVDGVAFKLSDYRGKVTVVDFWGYW